MGENTNSGKEVIFMPEYNNEGPQVEQIDPEEASKFEEASVEPNIFKRAWRKVSNGAKKAGRYALDHPFITMMGVTVGTTLVDAAVQGAKMAFNKDRAERMIYDDFSHVNVRTKRKLRPSELRELSERKEAGEHTIDILDDLDLLSKW